MNSRLEFVMEVYFFAALLATSGIDLLLLVTAMFVSFEILRRVFVFANAQVLLRNLNGR